MSELPECHNNWPVCAGRIDWTTFVDFTNIAAVGIEQGYETVFYGPQNMLEQMSDFVHDGMLMEDDGQPYPYALPRSGH